MDEAMATTANDTWWAIAGDILFEMLQRAEQGENSELLYLELIANSSTERVDGE